MSDSGATDTERMHVSWIIRACAAAGAAAIFTVGALGDQYEPGHSWVMPACLVALGAAVGRWWVLALALLPVLLAIPEGAGGDPPALPAAIYLALLGAGLLAVGVAVSKTLCRRFPQASKRSV
jgi:hypothetical protein